MKLVVPVIVLACLVACSTSGAPDSAAPSLVLAPSAGPASPTVSPNATPPPPAGADRTACSFSWRASDSMQFDRANQKTIALENTPGTQRFELQDFDLAVTSAASTKGGTTLQLEANAGPARVEEKYDFGPNRGAAHLPGSGHGFTGLRYLFHPDTQSELQFFCGTYDGSADLSDETVSQAAPGPAASPASGFSCTASVTDDAGAELGQRTFTPGSGPGGEVVRLGAFQLGVQHVEGKFDSGGVTIDIATESSPETPIVHSLYQLSGKELPANIVDGTFTGQQHLRAGGQHLQHSCRTIG